MKPVKSTLDQMVQEGIIETVTEPSEWVSCMVPVHKPGGKVRVTVDYRKLNSCLKRENFPIPTFDELSYKLHYVKFMSKLDASSGFFQIPLDEKDRLYTAFLTPWSRYMFKRLPMGINIAPEIYQRKMCELLDGVEGVLVYMDDILIYGESESKHDEILNKVLSIVKSSGLKLNKKKCIFKVRQVTFLGHLVTDSGISATPDKIEAIS